MLSQLHFWKLYHKNYPLLAQIARSLLCIVVTSVPSESMFSTTGVIQNETRNRLKPETLENIVFLKENLF